MVARSLRVGVQKDEKNSPSALNESRDPGAAGKAGTHAFRLRKRTILRGHGSFTNVLAEGRTLSSPPLRLFYRFTPDSSEPLVVGFAVSRVVRQASKRNRLKRMLREAFRLHQHLLDHQDTPVEMLLMFTGASGRVRPPYRSVDQALQALIHAFLGQRP